jgi:hypothetical protein
MIYLIVSFTRLVADKTVISQSRFLRRNPADRGEFANFVADNELGRPFACTHSCQSRHGELSKSVGCYSQADSSQLASLTTQILNFP